jgi:hypothetical protein
MNLLALAVFATIDETAIDALRHAASTCDPHYECGGVVRKVDGGFTASTLTTSTKPFGVDLGQLYGADVVADFHTHICSVHNKPFADFFSPADAMVNQGLHTVGYMLSLCDRNIRRYDPSQDDRDDEEVDFHSGRVIYLTSGHIVGWAPQPAEEQFAATLTDESRQPEVGPGLSDATLRPVGLHARRHVPRTTSGRPLSLTLSATTYSAGVTPAPKSHGNARRP